MSELDSALQAFPHNHLDVSAAKQGKEATTTTTAAVATLRASVMIVVSSGSNAVSTEGGVWKG